jgi:hypothetical protein
MAGPYTLTWDHGVTADDVSEFEVTQSEGDFAALSVVVKNPRVGLLSGNLWATLADGTGTLFYGRLIGVPDDLQADSVRLTFLARPDTYDADKAALAETLKVDPFWDPVFIAPDERQNPDAVLEARPQLWHTDRVTHAVTVSDILQGEAGTTVIDPDLVPYDSVKVAPGETPAELITCRAEVHWRQQAKGQVSLSAKVMEAFEAANSASGGYIITYSGDGLFGDWPRPGQNFGGGWSVANATIARNSELTSLLGVGMSTGGFTSSDTVPKTGGLFPVAYQPVNIVYGGGLEDWGDGTFANNAGAADDQEVMTLEINAHYPITGTSFKRPNYYDDGPADRGGPSVVGFPKWFMVGTVSIQYDADRERIETLEFTIAADVQPLVSAREDTNITVEMTSAEVDQPIDAGGAMPIGDPRRSSYFLQDRGKRSLEYLIALCRARLLARARAVQVRFTTTLAVGRALSLRHSATLADPRLPGGIATGKVIDLALSFSASSGEAKADVVLGCTIGRGNTLVVTDPASDYVDETYVVPSYQTVSGGATAVAADISYAPIDGTPVTPGFDFFASDAASSAVNSLTVENGASEQADLLLSQTWTDTNEAVAALNEIPTTVTVELIPVTGDPLVTPFTVTVSDLMVPKTIDLE